MVAEKGRIVGLDVTRSLAIIMVVISHYLPHIVSGHIEDMVESILGYSGVELFFALSGFLIGRIVIVMLEKKTPLTNFWTRRWLRTLPAYFLVLAALIAAELIAGHPASPSWLEYSVFFQSFIRLHDAEIYGATWSLATEEWFYLSLPLVLLALVRYGKLSARRAVLITCILGIVLCPIMRVIISSYYDQQWWVVRKYVFSRMDALLFGVLLAAVKVYWPEHFEQIVSRRVALSVVALAGLAAVSPIFYEQSYLETLIAKTVLFSFVSLCCALLVASLDTKTSLAGIAISFVTYISVTSYSVYLVHPAILDFAIKHFGDGIAVLLGAISTTYAVATLIYLYWELPMMQLRESLSVSAVGAR